MNTQEPKLGKILMWNIGIYLVYTFAIIFTSYFSMKTSQAKSLTFILLSFLFMGIHLFFMAIAALTFLAKHEKQSAKAYLLSILVILLIGFPLCSSLGIFF